MLRICVYMRSRFIENHPIWILEDKLLISEVVLSHFDTHDFFYREAQCSSVTKNSRRHPMRLRRYILERGDNGTKCCQKMKRGQRARLGSMKRKCDMT
jgi:hypothetical protein